MASLFNRRASDKRKIRPDVEAETISQAGPISAQESDLIIPEFQDETQDETQGETQDATSAPKPKSKTPNTDMPTAHNTSQVFTFIGASGGVGTTSLAAQTAFELAKMCRDKKADTRRPKDQHVCLIDLDFEGGACAYHVDILPNLSIEDLSGPASRIDAVFTTALTSEHDCGISLLAVPNTPQAHQHINPHAVMALLDAASQLYRYVVIDMPRYWQNWTPAVIGGSDFVGVLSELTVSSLHMARDRFNQISKELGDKDAPNYHAILNKYERRSFKNTLRLKDAETVLGRDVISTICIDTDTCREAINCGEPIGAIRPDSRYAKDTRQLIKTIFDSCTKDTEDHDILTGNGPVKSKRRKAA